MDCKLVDPYESTNISTKLNYCTICIHFVPICSLLNEKSESLQEFVWA